MARDGLVEDRDTGAQWRIGGAVIAHGPGRRIEIRRRRVDLLGALDRRAMVVNGRARAARAARDDRAVIASPRAMREEPGARRLVAMTGDEKTYWDDRRRLKGIPMPRDHDEHIKRLIDEINVERSRAERARAMRRRDALLGELEKLLPNVPLHQRGFGVMDQNDDQPSS